MSLTDRLEKLAGALRAGGYSNTGYRAQALLEPLPISAESKETSRPRGYTFRDGDSVLTGRSEEVRPARRSQVDSSVDLTSRNHFTPVEEPFHLKGRALDADFVITVNALQAKRDIVPPERWLRVAGYKDGTKINPADEKAVREAARQQLGWTGSLVVIVAKNSGS